MDRELRDARLRRLLDEMTRQLLYALAKAVGAEVGSPTYREDLIDALAAIPLPSLRLGLAHGITATDLRRLCTRLGYSASGSQAKLAARLIDAIEDRDARITRWRPYDQARSFARGLQLQSQAEWYAFVRGRLPAKGRRPEDVPMTPYAAYADEGWTNWGDFLGTDNPARRSIQYRSFTRARAYVRALEIANASEWKAFCAKRRGNRRVLPPDIPSTPDRVYSGQGWVSWGDWFGTGRVHGSKVEYRTHDAARSFVRSIGIRTEPEWRAYCRGETHRSKPRPLDVPSNPNRTYKGRGWISWGHFFGTNAVAVYKRAFRSYTAARAFVRKQGIVDSKAWRVWLRSGKRPPDIPAVPEKSYEGKGWVSWGEFCGTGNVHPARITWRPVRDAQPVVRALGLRSRREFNAAWHNGQLPKDIPLTIERMPGWKDWASFLGK